MSNERPGVEKVGRHVWDFLEEKFKLLWDKDENQLTELEKETRIVAKKDAESGLDKYMARRKLQDANDASFLFLKTMPDGAKPSVPHVQEWIKTIKELLFFSLVTS